MGLFYCLRFAHLTRGLFYVYNLVTIMRYEQSNESLYNKYRNGETLVYRDSNLKLLTDRAERGNKDAQQWLDKINKR